MDDLSVFMRIEGFVCPAEFWPALGYEGEARYVAIYWEQLGDEAAWADGREAFAGAHWPSYQALMRHNFSPGHPYHWLLGASDAQAVFWLVIERATEQAWLVPTDLAEKALRAQWPAPEAAAEALDVPDVAEDGIGVIYVALARVELTPQVVTWEDVERQMAADAARYDALVKALAGRPVRGQTVSQEEVQARSG